MDEPKQGLVKKQTWMEDELTQAKELLALCNAYEGLYTKLDIVMLRSRPGNETNDFLYYEHGQLVGLLSLNSFGDEDRELTGVVHPEYRRQGIFFLLMAAAREEAKQRGIQRLILVCERFSHSGQGFVEALGAKYDFSENKMILETLQEHGPYAEPITLRKAGVSDIDTIAAIISLCFGQSEEGARKFIAGGMPRPQTEYYIGEWQGTAIGCLSLSYGDSEIGIYGVGVLSQFRRRRFGRQMMEQIICKLQAVSQQPIALEVEAGNEYNIGLYRSCGFKEVTTFGYYNFDIK
ncbi:MAG TPA: GNAT family N-acetyltransferase [Ktedonobacteraceae bacterium]|nr:GNAT family N-acetyltransferase [Ktedonobacteraceae bacterium]